MQAVFLVIEYIIVPHIVQIECTDGLQPYY